MTFQKTFLLSLFLLALPAVAQNAPAPGLDTAEIERLTGAKGSLDAKSGVFKVSVPRTDLDVRVGGVHLKPRLGLTSWAAFQKAGNNAMVMGDMVLLEPQVNPVMSAALDSGLEVTALHNHFFGDEPKVMFMHIGGHGSVQGAIAAARSRKAAANVFRTPTARIVAQPGREVKRRGLRIPSD